MTYSRRRFLSITPAVLAAPPILMGYAAQAKSAVRDANSGSFRRFFVGEIEVIALWDGFAPIPSSFVTGFNPEAAQAAAREAYKPYDPNVAPISINGYVIKTGDRVIAVDTGAPTAMAPTVGRWAQSLALAGLSPDQIDTVFLTHMHGDHVAGLFDVAAGAVLLPKAEVIASQAEWDFTFSEEVYAALPEAFRPHVDYSRAVMSPYGTQFNGIAMDRDTEVAPGVFATPLPGHTPGHMGLRVSDGLDQLLIWGDAVHLPGYQFAHPEWSVIFDADAERAIQTRSHVLQEAATDRLRVAGMHLDFPSLGHVETRGDAFRYIPSTSEMRG